jgi:hypothetical protein
MNNDRNDWETILGKLTQESKPDRMGPALSLLNGIFVFGIFNGMTALSVMLSNMAVNSAWPNLDIFEPGIGYGQAFAVTGTFWMFYMLKVMISHAVGGQRGN